MLPGERGSRWPLAGGGRRAPPLPPGSPAAASNAPVRTCPGSSFLLRFALKSQETGKWIKGGGK